MAGGCSEVKSLTDLPLIGSAFIKYSADFTANPLPEQEELKLDSVQAHSALHDRP